jgi:FixJ family two-component response regulator
MEIMKLGAFHYLTKVVNREELLHTVSAAPIRLDQLMEF